MWPTRCSLYRTISFHYLHFLKKTHMWLKIFTCGSVGTMSLNTLHKQINFNLDCLYSVWPIYSMLIFINGTGSMSSLCMISIATTYANALSIIISFLTQYHLSYQKIFNVLKWYNSIQMIFLSFPILSIMDRNLLIFRRWISG